MFKFNSFFENPEIVDKYSNYSFKMFVYYKIRHAWTKAGSESCLYRLSLRIFHPHSDRALKQMPIVQTESLEELQIWCDLNNIDFSKVCEIETLKIS